VGCGDRERAAAGDLHAARPHRWAQLAL